MQSNLLIKDYSKIINIIIVFYAFTLPLSRASIVFFSFVLIVLWLLDNTQKQKYRLILHSKVIVALFVFLLFNLLSLLWSDDTANAFDYMLKYWYFLSIIVIFTTLQKAYVLKVLSAFIMGMFISEIISYGVFFELWQFKHAYPENPSPFMHHIEYSVFLAFTALIVLGRIFNHEELKYKLFYSIFFITISGNLFLTEGRTGQLAFLVGLFTLAIVSFKNKLKAFLVFIILSMGIMSLAFNLSQTFHDRMQNAYTNFIYAIDKQHYCSSLGSRIGAWIVSTDMILKEPLLGVGIIDNMEVFHQTINDHYPAMDCMHSSFMHIHNQFFQIATSLGLIGLALFLLMFYMIWKLPLKVQEYKNIKYIYISVLMFAFLPEVLFHRQFSMALFALIIGLLLAQNRIENEM